MCGGQISWNRLSKSIWIGPRSILWTSKGITWANRVLKGQTIGLRIRISYKGTLNTMKISKASEMHPLKTGDLIKAFCKNLTSRYQKLFCPRRNFNRSSLSRVAQSRDQWSTCSKQPVSWKVKRFRVIHLTTLWVTLSLNRHSCFQILAKEIILPFRPKSKMKLNKIQKLYVRLQLRCQ